MADSLTVRSLTRHHTYYIASADLSFLLGHVQFRVHRYFFERESAFFRGKLTTPMSPGASRQGSSDATPLVLEDVKPEDFERFLWVFYNPRYSLYDAKVDDWVVILNLSHQWGFAEVKSLAVRELEKKEQSSIDRIVVYQLNDVDRNLLIPHYAAICAREAPLTLPEGLKLGMETTLVIASAREYVRAIPTSNGLRSPTTPTVQGDELYDMIRELFNIPVTERTKVESAPTKDDANPSSLSGGSPKKPKQTTTKTAPPPPPPIPAPTPLPQQLQAQPPPQSPRPPPQQQKKPPAPEPPVPPKKTAIPASTTPLIPETTLAPPPPPPPPPVKKTPIPEIRLQMAPLTPPPPPQPALKPAVPEVAKEVPPVPPKEEVPTPSTPAPRPAVEDPAPETPSTPTTLTQAQKKAQEKAARKEKNRLERAQKQKEMEAKSTADPPPLPTPEVDADKQQPDVEVDVTKVPGEEEKKKKTTKKKKVEEPEVKQEAEKKVSQVEEPEVTQQEEAKKVEEPEVKQQEEAKPEKVKEEAKPEQVKPEEVNEEVKQQQDEEAKPEQDKSNQNQVTAEDAVNTEEVKAPEATVQSAEVKEPAIAVVNGGALNGNAEAVPESTNIEPTQEVEKVKLPKEPEGEVRVPESDAEGDDKFYEANEHGGEVEVEKVQAPANEPAVDKPAEAQVTQGTAAEVVANVERVEAPEEATKVEPVPEVKSDIGDEKLSAATSEGSQAADDSKETSKNTKAKAKKRAKKLADAKAAEERKEEEERQQKLLKAKEEAALKAKAEEDEKKKEAQIQAQAMKDSQAPSFPLIDFPTTPTNTKSKGDTRPSSPNTPTISRGQRASLTTRLSNANANTISKWPLPPSAIDDKPLPSSPSASKKDESNLAKTAKSLMTSLWQ